MAGSVADADGAEALETAGSCAAVLDGAETALVVPLFAAGAVDSGDATALTDVTSGRAEVTALVVLLPADGETSASIGVVSVPVSASVPVEASVPDRARIFSTACSATDTIRALGLVVTISGKMEASTMNRLSMP